MTSRLSAKARKQARALGVDYDFLWMRASGAQLAKITDLVDTGIIRPVVAQTYPFEQTPEALAALTTGGHPGKIVIRRD